jgi:error-prone DNA polymerase
MEDRTIVEWDKDDLDSLGILKIDILALGMLTCIRKAFDLLAPLWARSGRWRRSRRRGATYDMLCRADTIGVFQVESRAQMTMLPRLRPRDFYDLVIEVAIVRPGPIQGDMVHPYLRRRRAGRGDFPSPGTGAGARQDAGRAAVPGTGDEDRHRRRRLHPGEADSCAAPWRPSAGSAPSARSRQKMVEGMVANGYERDFAERCFRQIEGFGEYGFPESHAASFACLSTSPAWLKAHYPDVFCAAPC